MFEKFADLIDSMYGHDEETRLNAAIGTVF
jgi:hypothetical protein